MIDMQLLIPIGIAALTLIAASLYTQLTGNTANVNLDNDPEYEVTFEKRNGDSDSDSSDNGGRNN